MCAEGDHGLGQEDKGERRRVRCCCAAHKNGMHDVTSYTLPHALLHRLGVPSSFCKIHPVWAQLRVTSERGERTILVQSGNGTGSVSRTYVCIRTGSHALISAVTSQA